MSETPILDLECDPPKLHRSWLPTALGLLIGISLIGSVTMDPLWWFPILYASVAVHEIGHLVAAKLCGMEAGGIVVGGLMILRSGDRWLCRFDFRRILSGGIAKPLPTRADTHRAEHAWMVAGGPIATILLAAVSGIALLNYSHPPAWLSTLWWINLLLSFSTLIPVGGINRSDGPRLWLLLRQPEEAKSWVALVRLQAQDTVGVLPRDWDPELVAQMLEYNPESGDSSYRQLLAFYRCIDEGDSAAALTHLEKALEGSGRCGLPVRQWCFLEAACSSAVLRGNPAAARTWLERGTRLRKPASTFSLEAAIAQSEARYHDALPLWDKALAFLVKHKLDSGLARFGKELTAKYRSQCAAAIAAESQKTAVPSP
jgi:hypothetical protein